MFTKENIVTNNRGSRDIAMDVLKFWTILCVMYAHLIQYFILDNEVLSPPPPEIFFTI